MLYDSLQEKIIPLSDDVIVYPAHGPGSSYGKNIGPDTDSTIGAEKQFNYALKTETKEEFIKVVRKEFSRCHPIFPLMQKSIRRDMTVWMKY